MILTKKSRRQAQAKEGRDPEGRAVPAEVTGAEILRHFENAQSLKFQPISATVDKIGPWDEYDDWDWGRLIFEWRRPNLRVMVSTQGGYIRKVVLLDPSDMSRFGTTPRILLDEPFDIESRD